jgi:hypothetical protein
VTTRKSLLGRALIGVSLASPLTIFAARSDVQNYAEASVNSGVLHMEADPNWTPDGAIPLPDTYVGQVTLTLTASD